VTLDLPPQALQFIERRTLVKRRRLFVRAIVHDG
jgi:hypothetical protein